MLAVPRLTNSFRGIEHAGESTIGNFSTWGKAKGVLHSPTTSPWSFSISRARLQHHTVDPLCRGELSQLSILRPPRSLRACTPHSDDTLHSPRMASTYVWLTRCIPAFSVVFCFTLLFTSLIISPYGKGESGNHTGEATIPQLILSVYTVLLHILSIVFPVRVCWSMRDVLKKMREAGNDMPSGRRPRVQSIGEKGSEQIPVPLFVIILPAYKEEMATLEETLRVLASHLQARASYHVRTLCRPMPLVVSLLCVRQF